MAAVTAAGALRVGAAAGASYAAWRQLYVSFYGRHQLCVRADFELGLPPPAGFKVMSDPCLLDETTPWWFHLVIRDGSWEAIRGLRAVVEGTSSATFAAAPGTAGFGSADSAGTSTAAAAAAEGSTASTASTTSAAASSSAADHGSATATKGDEEVVRISYWLFFGHLLPLPWTSSVGPVGLKDGWRRLVYRQATGPYGAFEHEHRVGALRPSRVGMEAAAVVQPVDGDCCLVEDRIVATVFGEPLLDGIAAVLLLAILRTRGRCLTDRFGGRVLSVRREA